MRYAICLDKTVQPSSLFSCPAVKRFAVDRSDGASASHWQQFVESDVGEPDSLQTTSLTTPPTPATFLRLRILGGYKEFVTIRSLEVQLAS